MTDAQPATTPRVLQVGPDRVTISDKDVAIEAKSPLPDWEVREINHVPVYLDDKKYYLIEKRKAEKPFAVRYLLVPWPQYQATNARTFHSYDLEAVREREGELRTGKFEELGRAFLMPFYPALGLLWSRTQHRLVRFGFVPHSITGLSIFTVFSLMFGQGVFAVILLNSALRTGKIMIGGYIRALATTDHIVLGPVSVPVALIDLLLLLALLIDCIVRYSKYLRDDQWSGGFLEWTVPSRRPVPVQPKPVEEPAKKTPAPTAPAQVPAQG